MKQRVQHPAVNECKERGTPYWFVRYWDDALQPDGNVKTSRKRHIIGPSKGANAISKKQAELKRDQFLAELNSAPSHCEAAVAAKEPPEVGAILFGKLADIWRHDFVEREVGGRGLIAASTREKYINHLKNHILPHWQDTRLAGFRTKEILDWLQCECESWNVMADLRNIMSGIFAKAQEWEILPDSFVNPMHRVKLPKKWEVREKRILDENQTERVLARLEDPHLLINETCVDTGTRISEVTGLMIKHVDLVLGCIRIEQRNWRGDIDEPKTAKSRRPLALGALAERYRTWIAGLATANRKRGCSHRQMTGSNRCGTPGCGRNSTRLPPPRAATSPAWGRIHCGAPTSLGVKRWGAAASRRLRSPATLRIPSDADQRSEVMAITIPN